jgi:hypothetical protein
MICPAASLDRTETEEPLFQSKSTLWIFPVGL